MGKKPWIEIRRRIGSWPLYELCDDLSQAVCGLAVEQKTEMRGWNVVVNVTNRHRAEARVVLTAAGQNSDALRTAAKKVVDSYGKPEGAGRFYRAMDALRATLAALPDDGPQIVSPPAESPTGCKQLPRANGVLCKMGPLYHSAQPDDGSQLETPSHDPSFPKSRSAFLDRSAALLERAEKAEAEAQRLREALREMMGSYTSLVQLVKHNPDRLVRDVVTGDPMMWDGPICARAALSPPPEPTVTSDLTPTLREKGDG